MVLVVWKWKNQVPSLDRIERTAENLLESAYKSAQDEDINYVSYSATGGFLARYFNRNKTFELTFALENSDSYIDGEENNVKEVYGIEADSNNSVSTLEI